jgi:hypothetical protein
MTSGDGDLYTRFDLRALSSLISMLSTSSSSFTFRGDLQKKKNVFNVHEQ